MQEIFGATALLLSLCANVPYLIEMPKGEVRPERISWLLWTLLGLTYYFSALFSDGATWFTFGELIGPVLIFLFALKYGVGGTNKFDLLSLAVALIAFMWLLLTTNVLLGLVLALFVDGIAAMLTIRKVLTDPSSESTWFWGIGALSAVAALLSLTVFTAETLLFPLYVLITSTCIFLLARPQRRPSRRRTS